MLMKQIEQLEDTEVESDVANVEKKPSLHFISEKLLKQSLKTLSKTPSLKIDQEQEYSRVISNMLTDCTSWNQRFTYEKSSK